MTVAANYAGNDERAKAFTDRTGIKAYKWDVGDFDACQKGCQQVADELGPVDVVVNNAGITRDGTMPKMTYEMWDEVMRTNLGGRSEEHTSELQSLMRISYAVFCLKQKKTESIKRKIKNKYKQ